RGEPPKAAGGRSHTISNGVEQHALQPRASVIQPEKLNHGFDVPLAANVIGDPSGLGVVVMQVCSAFGNQFLPNPNGERKICEPVAVQMADFAMPHMEEDQPSEMRRDGNSGP